MTYFNDGERKLTHIFLIMEYIGTENGLYHREEDLIDFSLIREQMKDIIDLEMNCVYFSRKKMLNTVLLTLYTLNIHCCQRQLLQYSMKISCMDAKRGRKRSVLIFETFTIKVACVVNIKLGFMD